MNKLTKLLSVFVIAGAIGTGVAGAVGCANNDSGHKHDWEYTQITGNAEEHTKHCKADGHTGADTTESHDWSGDECSKCHYPKPNGGQGLVIPATVTGILIEGVTAETITLSPTKTSHTIDKSAIHVYFATGANADQKGTEVPAANLVLELKDGNGAAVSSWENIKKDGQYKVNASIKDATMAGGATATIGDLKKTVTVTISNPVQANSLTVKEGATLTQPKSVQDKMSADWTYEVTLANGDKEDYTEPVTVAVDTNTVGTQTATLTSGNLTGTVEVVITAAANHSETYAYNTNAKAIGTISADAETAAPVELFKSANGNTKLEVCGAKVEANGNNAAKECDGKYFSTRTPLNGATFTSTNTLQKNQRYFILTTEGAAKLTVYWSRNSSNDERGISVFNSTVTEGNIANLTPGAETIAKATLTTGDQSIQKTVVNIPAAGTYWLTSANNQNVYFYYIELTTEFDGAGTDVVLEDGANALANVKVNHDKVNDEAYKQQFTVGDTFTVDAGYSVTGTFVTANTAKKSEQTLTDNLTYWVGTTQLTPGTTVLSADLFTALGENTVTVKYGEETVTGSYTIVVESAVPGVTGITASVKDTVNTTLPDASAKLTLNKTDIEAAIVGENANATVDITSVKYKAKGADDSTAVEITDSVQLGAGDYVILVTATVADATADKSASFETTVDLKVMVDGAMTYIKAEEYTGKLDDANVGISGLFAVTTDKSLTVTDYPSGKNEGKAVAEDGQEFTKAWLPGGNVATNNDRGFTITAQKDITVTVYWVPSDGSFGARKAKLIWTTTPAEGAATTGESAVLETTSSGGVAFATEITLKAGDSCRVSIEIPDGGSAARPAIFGFAVTETTAE